MTKLRESTGVILWILVFAFGVVWVLQDSNVFETIGQQTRNIAVVNGAPVLYEEYQNALQQQRDQFRQRFGGELNQRMEEMAQEQTYEQLVTQELIQQEMERLGITVTDQEVEDMIFGPNPHPVIRRQFADSTGQIDYALLNNLAQNPEMKPQLIQLEQFLKEQRRQQKMGTMVRATLHVSEEDVKDAHYRQSASSNTQYVALPYGQVPNDSVSVSESDLQDYYDANQEDFKKAKTFTLEYVSIPKTATASDTASVTEDLEELREEFAAAESDSLFLADNASDQSYNGSFRTAADMPAPVADAIYSSLEPGTVVGPVYANDLAHLIKIQEVQPAETPSVHARHILLRSSDTDPEILGRLQAIEDSIRSGDATFAEMARRYSDDGSASQGGDLGWFGPDRMVDAFSDAAFDADPGEIVGPIKTQFGYHLIQVDARADQAVRYADLAYSLSPSISTLNELENTLEDIAYYAEDDGSFTDEAESRDLAVQTVQVEADQQVIPGIGRSRSILTFLEGAEAGTISSVFELDDKFVVMRVEGVEPEGYRPFSEVKAEIRPRVLIEKKKAVQVRRMEQALRQNGFEGMADALGTRTRTSEVSFTTTRVPGIGNDPTFAGTVFGLDAGETSGVVEGENAAFVVKVNETERPGELSAEDRQQLRQQILQRRQQQLMQQWIAELRDRAEIQDNRSVFQQ